MTLGACLPALVNPTVSIVLNNYNYGKFLGDALSSAVHQTYRSEVVVVDDGSTDNSLEILTLWQHQAKIIHQANGGQIAAYTAGLQASSGEVVIFLDSDDVLEPIAAEEVVKLFAGGVSKVHYRLRIIDDQGKPTGHCIPRKLGRGDVLAPLLQHGLLYPAAPGSGNAYRRSVLEKLFPLPSDPTDLHGADFFTGYGSAAFGQIAAHEAPLGSYRIHGEVTTGLQGFVLGNAERDSDLRNRLDHRYTRFRKWIAERTAGAVMPPSQVLDFSVQKTIFVTAILGGSANAKGFRKGATEMFLLLKALWLRPEDGVPHKLALSVWAVAVLLAPRVIARPLARFVSNPASR